LSYHLLDREQGLFYALMEQRALRVPYPLESITSHSLCPPGTTRAAVRGRCIEKFGSAVQATQWDYILLKGAQKKIELDLRNLFDASLVKQSLKIISAAQTVEDLAQLKFAKIV
jgi:proteasome accessory factor A